MKFDGCKFIFIFAMINFEQIKVELLQHDYECLKLIGSGSYSYVFLCKSLKYNSLFAVKRIEQNKYTDYEYNILINLNHQYIIQLYEVFEEGNSQYLVIEYCPNETFKEKGKLNYDQFIHYSKQILEALSYCHSKKIAHRDIKPANIFIDKYDRIKLADFGFAKQFDKDKISNERCGSVMYCSPEIIKYQSFFNPFKADIYALGITFFYMATGKHPFPCSSIEYLKRSIVYGQIDFDQFEIDEEIKSMIMKMISHNPKLRPSVDELLELPIYQQNESSLANPDVFKPKNKFNYIYKQICPYMTQSRCINDSAKRQFQQKKFNYHKCNIICPNIPKKNWKL